MPGYFLEFTEKDRSFLYELSEQYTEESYKEKLKAGKIVRPAGVNGCYFLPEILDNYFLSYKELVKDKPEFSRELKFIMNMHNFKKDPTPFYWPWACGFLGTYKNVPVLFPFFSASNCVMKSTMPIEIKRNHLIEVLPPALEKTNLIFQYEHGPASPTSQIIQDLTSHLFVDLKLLKKLPGGRSVSRIVISKRHEDLVVLKEQAFIDLLSSIMSKWFQVNSTEMFLESEKSYFQLPIGAI